jgi:hypothetical protein
MLSAIREFIRGALPALSDPQNSGASGEHSAVAKRPLEWKRQPVVPGPTTAQMRRYADSIESKYQRGLDAKVKRHEEKVDRFIETSRKRAVSGKDVLQERSVLRREPQRMIFKGAKLKIPHAFETPTVFVTQEGSRIHVDAMRRQRPGPPPRMPTKKEFTAIKTFDTKQATFTDEKGEKHVGKIVSTAGPLLKRFQLASLAEVDEPLIDQASTSDPVTSLPNAPNSGEPS